jgi:hypothetical protein
MPIDLLYFGGFPSSQDGLENLKTALEQEGMDTQIRQVCVEDNAHATELKFLGSLSFQFNGQE